MFLLTLLDRRGSPSDHLSDRGRNSPRMDEQMAASDSIPRGSSSPYASMSNAPEYPAHQLEQSTYPNSPDLYYSSLPQVSYHQQSQYAHTPSYYPPASSGAYLGTAHSPPATAGAQSYSSYYAPVPSTQANWPAASTESRDFIGLSGSYDPISDLPLEPSSLNADLFQFCEPDNPQ